MIRRTSQYWIALVALTAACTDGELPTGVGPATPAFVIMDGAHGANVAFHFLPPLVPDPPLAGELDAAAQPEVRICAWTGSACGATIATFTTASGDGGEVVRVDLEAGHFGVNWHTDRFPLETGAIYRIRVLLNGAELGYADVQLASGGQELKNALTDAPIALKDGRTLPIHFHIAPGSAQPTLGPRDEREPMAAGSTHTCALDPAGAAWCWGSNFHGERGTGATGVAIETPEQVTGGHTFVALVAGFGFTCGLEAGGQAWCWGANSEGQLGLGYQSSNVPAPAAVVGGHAFAALSAGPFFVCGRTTTGEVWCWGYGPAGALGNGSYTTSPVPVKVVVPGDPAFAWIEAGGGHACGLTTTGTAWCWGLNEWGQLGRGTLTQKDATPAVAAAGMTFRSLAASGAFTCGLDAGGAAYCWGDNALGQLGRGTLTGAETSVAPVAGGLSFVRIVAGLQFACGIAVDGTAHCWGANDYAQLGTGASGPFPDNALPTPQPVLGRPSWPVLAPGSFHACGIVFDGTARCWGNNSSRQVGAASPSMIPAHTTVGGGQTFALP